MYSGLLSHEDDTTMVLILTMRSLFVIYSSKVVADSTRIIIYVNRKSKKIVPQQDRSRAS